MAVQNELNTLPYDSYFVIFEYVGIHKLKTLITLSKKYTYYVQETLNKEILKLVVLNSLFTREFTREFSAYTIIWPSNPATQSVIIAIKKIYSNNYVCVDDTTGSLYEFKNHCWNDGNLEIIINKINQYISLIEYLISMSRFHKNTVNEIELLLKYIKKFKSYISRYFASTITDASFRDKLDKNNHLIGFANGVYDLNLKQFRNGVQNDMISINTSYDYVKYNHNSQEIIDVKKILNQVIPDIQEHNNFLKFIANSLCGSNGKPMTHIIDGISCSGKSSIILLIEKAFGNYFYNIMSIDILSKFNLAPHIGNKKIIIIHDESQNSILIKNFIDYLSQDKIIGREIYQSSVTFVPNYNILCTVRYTPELQKYNKTMFNSRFVDNDKVNETKYHYLRDDEMYDKIEKLGPAFMWLLLQKL